MEKTRPKYRCLVRIWQSGTCQPGRSYPFTEEQEARNAYDVALKLYDADVFTVQLFDSRRGTDLAWQSPVKSILLKTKVRALLHPNFQIGREYSRKDDIHDRFDGQRQGGPIVRNQSRAEAKA